MARIWWFERKMPPTLDPQLMVLFWGETEFENWSTGERSRKGVFNRDPKAYCQAVRSWLKALLTLWAGNKMAEALCRAKDPAQDTDSKRVLKRGNQRPHGRSGGSLMSFWLLSCILSQQRGHSEYTGFCGGEALANSQLHLLPGMHRLLQNLHTDATQQELGLGCSL